MSDSEDEEIWGMLAGCAPEEELEAKVTALPPVTKAAAVDGPLTPPSRAAPDCCSTGHPSSVGETLSSPESQEEPVAVAAPSAPSEARSCCGGAALAPSNARSERSRVVESRFNRIPAEILDDPELNAAIDQGLPSSHNFEIHRTVWRLRRYGSRHVGLQLPEGLQQWALTLADILQRFVPTMETSTVMCDVTFGACCIDDLGARAVGVDFLVHYGHSCIVPTDQTTVSTLYVHVSVDIDVEHLVETVKANFGSEKRLAFMGTVQFSPGIMKAVEQLKDEYFSEDAPAKVPQVKPLSIGETLGCTSPLVESNVDVVVFVCDGRFHLESAMIQNPHVKGGFFRYDPFYRSLSRESFAHEEMHRQRRASIQAAKGAGLVGLILSTLGRQGSVGVLDGVERLLEDKGIPHVTVLLSDVAPDQLARFEGVDCWVQVACPRLSIDWGDAYNTPLLTPYEAHIAWGTTEYKDIYPMDYYSNRGGPWSNYGAHNGHGGSLDKKFRHMSRRNVEYEEN